MEDTGKGKRRRPSPDEPTPSPPAASASELPASDAAEESAVQEEEMEKFYALLRSIKATREQCRVRAQKRAKQKNEAAPPLWKPTFEMEDFDDDALNNKIKGKDKIKGKERGEDEEGSDGSSSNISLDLNLGVSNAFEQRSL